MSTIHRFRPAVFVVAVCTFAISAPIAVNADDQVIVDEQISAALEQVPALAPAVSSWDESSGYGSVEASRAAASALLAPVAGPSWDETSGYGSVERTRAEMTASLSGELDSGQEQAAALAAAAAMSWDETSGYGSVEVSRAANALPEAPAASMSSQDYPVVLDRGTRAESAILWTILHREEETAPVALLDC